jgi:hypothetical protein
MLGLSSHPRTRPTRGEIERRLRLLEQAVERRSGRISANAVDAARPSWGDYRFSV